MPPTSPTRPIGVAVIGAGMAGRAHLAGYRAATTLAGRSWAAGGRRSPRPRRTGARSEQVPADTGDHR